MSILLTGAEVVTSLDPPRVARADLLVEKGRVAALGSPAAGGAARIDCGGCLIVPGNVCSHTHAYSALARGMPYRLPAPTSFLEILQRIWWRLDRALDERSIRASALVAGRDALRAGTTTLVDHHASPNAIDGSLHIIAEALGELGIRSVLAYEVTDRDGEAKARAGVEENARFLRRTAEGWYPLARGMVGAHASFTLSEETLASCVDLTRTSGTGLHIHVAEDAVDETDAVARCNARTVARLASAGALTEQSLLAHAVHLDTAEAELVVRSRATIAHNPRSNMNNGVGRTPVAWLGERIALGTDGIGADMFEEARAAFFRRREEDLETGADWALGRLARGGRLAGRIFGEPLLGRLEIGAPADLAVLESAAPAPLHGENLAGHWIFGLSAASVRDVLVAGELVLRQGRLTRIDEKELDEHAREQAGLLWERMDSIPPHPFTPSRLLATPIGGS